MHEHHEYQQGAFDLTSPTPASAPHHEGVIGDADHRDDTPLPGRLDQFHTPVPSNRPVPGEGWAEYQVEAAFRAAHALPAVSPTEFAQMTDWGGDFPDLPKDRSENNEEARDGVHEPAFTREIARIADGSEGERPRLRQETAKPTKVVTENTVFDARQERVACAMETLTRSVERITTSDGYRAYLEALARFHHYSANNVLLIQAQQPEATRVASYRTWQSLGRQVQKGEKGITIIRPVTVKTEDEVTGKPVEIVRGFTTGSVFDVHQTAGKELPEGPTPGVLPEDADEAALTIKVRVMQLLAAQGVRVVRETLPEGRRGYWEPGAKKVGINTALAGVGEVKTLVHEAAHCLADHRPGAIDRADGETVAESAAFVVLQHYGVDTGDYSFPYVAGWAKERAVLDRNLGMIRAVSHTLIAAIGDDCLPDGAGEGNTGHEGNDGEGGQ